MTIFSQRLKQKLTAFIAAPIIMAAALGAGIAATCTPALATTAVGTQTIGSGLPLPLAAGSSSKIKLHISTPAVADNRDGRLEVFARGTDGAVWHDYQTAPGSGPWSGWSSLGGVVTSDPAVALNHDGRLEVFAVGTDSAVWHDYQTIPASGPWSGWSSLGQP